MIGYLKDQNHPHFALMGTRSRLQASKHLIEDAIISAAAKVDVHLVKQGTEKRHRGKFAAILACNQWRAFQPRKDASDIQKNVYKDMNSGEQTLVKEGIKHDNFINRRAAQRKAGQTSAKRTYTTKPPPDQTCSFQVRICLDPGKCWYLPAWAGNAWHNHEKLGAHETRRRMVTLSSRQVSIRVMERLARLAEF